MAQRQKPLRGFTLLEVVVSLAILLMIFSIGTLSMTNVIEKGKVNKQVTALKLAARKCMRKAMLEQRSYTLIVLPDRFAIGPTYMRANTEDYFAANLDETPVPPGYSEHVLPEEMWMEVMRWGEKGFRNPVRLGDRWEFQPSGICEPISIGIARGDAYHRVEFNPLTARTEDEEFYYP